MKLRVLRVERVSYEKSAFLKSNIILYFYTREIGRCLLNYFHIVKICYNLFFKVLFENIKSKTYK